MSDYFVLDSLGDGNCLFNSVAINLVCHLEDPAQKDAWLEIFKKEPTKQHYIELANVLSVNLKAPLIKEKVALKSTLKEIEGKNKNNNYKDRIDALKEKISKLKEKIEQLSPLQNNAKPENIFARFKDLIKALKDNYLQNWDKTEKIIAQSLRKMTANAVRNDAIFQNASDETVNISSLLNPLFDKALQETFLTYVNTNRVEGFFQSHPGFIRKLQDLLKDEPFEKMQTAYRKTEAAKVRIEPSNEYQLDYHKVRFEAFKTWFYESEGGKEAFLSHPTHGLETQGAWTTQFPLHILSALLGLSFFYKTHPKETYIGDKLSVVDDAKRWMKIRRGEEMDALPEEAKDPIFYLFSIQEHWKACLPRNERHQTIARLYALLTERHFQPKTPKEKLDNPFPEVLSMTAGILVAFACIWLIAPTGSMFTAALTLVAFGAGALATQIFGNWLLRKPTENQSDNHSNKDTTQQPAPISKRPDTSNAILNGFHESKNKERSDKTFDDDHQSHQPKKSPSKKRA